MNEVNKKLVNLVKDIAKARKTHNKFFKRNWDFHQYNKMQCPRYLKAITHDLSISHGVREPQEKINL